MTLTLSLSQLQAMCQTKAGRSAAVRFHPHLVELMPLFGIQSADAVQVFLAQLLHESGEFRYVRELASGAAYEGRSDLGNVEPGDGVRFRGRGLIQITGRLNYAKCGAALDLDLLNHPELLEEDRNAVLSACWFWESRGLTALAEAGKFLVVTRRINGGLNGLADRKEYLLRARAAFAV